MNAQQIEAKNIIDVKKICALKTCGLEEKKGANFNLDNHWE